MPQTPPQKASETIRGTLNGGTGPVCHGNAGVIPVGVQGPDANLMKGNRGEKSRRKAQ